METIIYIDVIFILQGAIHCFLLKTASKISGYNYYNWFTLLLGGFVASLCHILWLIFFFPNNGGILLSFFTISISILISFSPKTLSYFIRIFLSSIFASFLFSGGLNILFMVGKTQHFLGQGITVLPITFPWYYLLWGTIVGYIIIKKCDKWITNHITKRQEFCNITIFKKDKNTTAYLLIDTGNTLVFENQGIVIVEFATLINLFTYEEIQEILTGNRNLLTPFPFNSLGNTSDNLWGFKADKVIVYFGEKKIIHNDFWIGINFQGFTGGFEGLAPTDLISNNI